MPLGIADVLEMFVSPAATGAIDRYPTEFVPLEEGVPRNQSKIGGYKMENKQAEEETICMKERLEMAKYGHR